MIFFNWIKTKKKMSGIWLCLLLSTLSSLHADIWVYNQTDKSITGTISHIRKIIRPDDRECFKLQNGNYTAIFSISGVIIKKEEVASPLHIIIRDSILKNVQFLSCCSLTYLNSVLIQPDFFLLIPSGYYWLEIDKKECILEMKDGETYIAEPGKESISILSSTQQKEILCLLLEQEFIDQETKNYLSKQRELLIKEIKFSKFNQTLDNLKRQYPKENWQKIVEQKLKKWQEVIIEMDLASAQDIYHLFIEKYSKQYPVLDWEELKEPIIQKEISFLLEEVKWELLDKEWESLAERYNISWSKGKNYQARLIFNKMVRCDSIEDFSRALHHYRDILSKQQKIQAIEKRLQKISDEDKKNEAIGIILKSFSKDRSDLLESLGETGKKWISQEKARRQEEGKKNQKEEKKTEDKNPIDEILDDTKYSTYWTFLAKNKGKNDPEYALVLKISNDKNDKNDKNTPQKCFLYLISQHIDKKDLKNTDIAINDDFESKAKTSKLEESINFNKKFFSNYKKIELDSFSKVKDSNKYPRQDYNYDFRDNYVEIKFTLEDRTFYLYFLSSSNQ